MSHKSPPKNSKNKKLMMTNKETASPSQIKHFRSTPVLALCILSGIITALSFSMKIIIANYDSAVQLAGTKSPLAVFLARLYQNFDGHSFSGAAAAVIYSYFYYQTIVRVKKAFYPPIVVLSAVFAFINVISLSMHYLESWNFVFENKYQFILSSICMLGYGLFFYAVTVWVFHLLDILPATTGPLRYKTRIGALWQNHTALISFVVILLCWIPWIVVFYPGTMLIDCASQIQQFFGASPYSSHHPVFSTWLMGGIVWLGHTLGNNNLGGFFYVLFQTLVSAFVFAQTTAYIKKLSCPVVVQISSLAYFALFPQFGAWMQNVIKDTIFAALFALYILMTIKIIIEPQKHLRSWKYVFIFGLLSFLLCLLRNNGFPIIFATNIALLLFMILSKLKGKALLSGCTLFFAVAYFVFNSVSLTLLHGTKGSVAEALSIPFQQTARYVRDHGDEVTPEEKDAIGNVINYDNLAERYKPDLSDPVKFSMHNKDKDALKKYFTVWFQMFLKHPDVYVQATLANSYSYYAFTPPPQFNENIVHGINNDYFEKAGLEFQYAFSDSSRFFLRNMTWVTRDVPLLGLLYSPALYTWLMAISSLYLFVRKKRKFLLIMVPALFLFLTCVAAPVNGMWRYFMPIVWASPAVFAAVFYASTQKSTEP